MLWIIGPYVEAPPAAVNNVVILWQTIVLPMRFLGSSRPSPRHAAIGGGCYRAAIRLAAKRLPENYLHPDAIQNPGGRS